MNPNNPKTNLLLAALRYVVAGPDSSPGPDNLKDLATHYFVDSDDNTLIKDIFKSVPTSPEASEEQKDTGSLDQSSEQDPTIENLISLLLADNEVDVYAKDSTGWPILFFALENYAVLKMLFERRPGLAQTFMSITAREPNNRNATPWDAFTWAAQSGHIKSLMLLLSKLSEPEAIAQKKRDIIKSFLNKDLSPATQNNFLAVLEKFELSPYEMNFFLSNAIFDKTTNAIRVLIKAPNAAEALNINLNRVGDPFPTLICAAMGGHTEALKVLLTVQDINVNIVDCENQTALIWAARRGHTEVIKVLLTVQDINVNIVDCENQTALMYAVKYNHPECATLIQTALNRTQERMPQPVAPLQTLTPVPSQTLTPVPSQTLTPVPSQTLTPVPSQTVAPALPHPVTPPPTNTTTLSILRGSLVVGIGMYFWGAALLSTAGAYTGLSFLMNLAAYSALTLGIGSFIITAAIALIASAYFAPNVHPSNVTAYAATDSGLLQENAAERITLRFSQPGIPAARALNDSDNTDLSPRRNLTLRFL